MSDQPTVLRGMLVTDLHGRTTDITRFGDKYPRVVISSVFATLVGHGIEIQRRYQLSDAPHIGDLVDIEL